MIRVAIAALLVVLFACEVDARPRRRARRSNAITYSNTTSYNTATSWGGGPQSVAESKAQQAAHLGAKGHLGGGYGGGYAEGVGFSTYSAQNALNNCCFTGQRSLAGSSVVRGSDGWYAVKIFW